MKTIEQTVKKIIKNENEFHKDNPNIKSFQKANDEFKSLIEKGIVEPRGNNLLSVDETHLNRSCFNATP